MEYGKTVAFSFNNKKNYPAAHFKILSLACYNMGKDSLHISSRPIYQPIFGIFQISASADKFFCLADAFEMGHLF